MHIATFLAFDDSVLRQNGPSEPVYSRHALNERLGRHEHLALHAIADFIDVDFDDTFTIALEHSNDGINWLPRASPQSTVTAYPEIQLSVSVAVGTTPATTLVQGMWSSANRGASGILVAAGPMLSLVRLKLCVALQSAAGHIRVYATQRELTAAASPAAGHAKPQRGG